MKNKFYIMTALVISLTGCSNIEDGTQPTGNFPEDHIIRIGSCCGHCLHPVLLQIQEDRAKIFQPPHLPGIVEFLSSDADRRCFMYFHPYARVL